MDGHPIKSLMETAMHSIKDMIDVNTVVGDAVETQDGTVIVPVSRVSVGFAAGGGDYAVERDGAGEGGAYPFVGGSGAGVTVQPVGFLVVTPDQVRLLPVTENVIYDRLIDLAPEVMDRLLDWIGVNGRAEAPSAERQPDLLEGQAAGSEAAPRSPRDGWR